MKNIKNIKKKKIKTLSDFDNDVVNYLEYLKTEYCDRFNYGNEQIFDEYIRVFSIQLSDNRNNKLLRKYQNAIKYSLNFLKNELQNMSYERFENNGIKYPEPWLETTLFDLLSNFEGYKGKFSKYAHCLGKICYLEDDCCDFVDKRYARDLLEEPKELIQQYVFFTNTEPDGERIVLVSLALYLEALTRESLLNRNIPNESQYRVNVLPKEKYEELCKVKPIPEEELSEKKHEELLKIYRSE